MRAAEVRSLVADYQESVTEISQGVEAGGVVYVHETLTVGYIRRVLGDVLSSLLERFGVADVLTVTVSPVEDPEPEEGEAPKEAESSEDESEPALGPEFDQYGRRVRPE